MSELVMFADFWKLYPVHINQRRAELAWLQMDCHLNHEIIPALKRQIDAREKKQAAGEWQPEWPHAHNWLKDERWKDQVEEPQSTWSARDYNAGRNQGRSDRRQIDTREDYNRLLRYIELAGKSEAYKEGYLLSLNEAIVE